MNMCKIRANIRIFVCEILDLVKNILVTKKNSNSRYSEQIFVIRFATVESPIFETKFATVQSSIYLNMSHPEILSVYHYFLRFMGLCTDKKTGTGQKDKTVNFPNAQQDKSGGGGFEEVSFSSEKYLVTELFYTRSRLQ